MVNRIIEKESIPLEELFLYYVIIYFMFFLFSCILCKLSAFLWS